MPFLHTSYEKGVALPGELSHARPVVERTILLCVVMEACASQSSDSSTGTISPITTELCHDVNSFKSRHQLIYCEIDVNQQPVKLQVDCGATVCILPKRYLGNHEIRPETVNLQMWNKSSVKALGNCKVHVKNPAT